jgi:hypothetical protein
MNDFSHFPLELAVSNNHYEMAESFANPYGPTGRAALEQMKLARG